MTKVLFFLFLFVLVNTQDVIKPNFPKYSLEQFKQYCKKEQKTIVIVLSSINCPPCRMFYSSFDAINAMLKQYFIFIEVDNIDSLHPCSGIPTFIAYKNGNYIDKTSGFSNKDEYIIRLKSISNQQTQPLSQQPTQPPTQPSQQPTLPSPTQPSQPPTQQLVKPNFPKYDKSSFNNYIKTEKKTIIVVDSDMECGPCRKFYSNYQIILSNLKDVIFIEVDGIKEMHSLYGIPAFIIYIDGKFIDKIMGFSSVDLFIINFEKIISSIKADIPKKDQPKPVNNLHPDLQMINQIIKIVNSIKKNKKISLLVTINESESYKLNEIKSYLQSKKVDVEQIFK